MLSFSESLHTELHGSGVTVTALCPGPVRTEFAQVAGLAETESLPGFLWADAKQVAEAGIRGLERGRRVVIPGTLNRAGAIGGHHAPRSLFLPLASRVYPAARK